MWNIKVNSSYFMIPEDHEKGHFLRKYILWNKNNDNDICNSVFSETQVWLNLSLTKNQTKLKLYPQISKSQTEDDATDITDRHIVFNRKHIYSELNTDIGVVTLSTNSLN